MDEAVDCGFIDEKAVFIDGTHIKANANKRKFTKEEVDASVRKYQKQLEKEIDKDRKEHGKEPLIHTGKKCDNTSKKKLARRKKEAKKKQITKSKTDPESGMFHKGEHERQFAYVANTACDNNNFVLDFVVGAGNIHDSVMFDEVYDKVVKRFPKIEAIAIDAGYKTPWIAKKITDDGRIPLMPYKRPMTKKGFFKKCEYVYDEYYDCMICPNNEVLKYSTTNRDGYREYKSDPKICAACPYRNKCTESKANQKTVTRHIWEDYLELAEDYRHTPKYKEIYERRKETIERVFADAKERHGMRYTQYRGLEKVKAETALRFACMNLKKLAQWKWKTAVRFPVLQFIWKKVMFLKWNMTFLSTRVVNKILCKPPTSGKIEITDDGGFKL